MLVRAHPREFPGLVERADLPSRVLHLFVSDLSLVIVSFTTIIAARARAISYIRISNGEISCVAKNIPRRNAVGF